MPGSTDQPRVPTEDMISVHQVFRNALAAAPDLIASTDGGNGSRGAERVRLASDYFANVLAFLHAHHEGEDDVITPLLRERAADQDLIDHLEAQHVAVLPALAAAEAALAVWRDTPSAESASAFQGAIAALDAELTVHLDQEEVGLLPLVAEHLTPAEWGQMPGHTLRIFTGDKVWLIIGLIREQMTEERKAAMLANMPPPAAEMWTTQGNAAFDEFVADLRHAA